MFLHDCFDSVDKALTQLIGSFAAMTVKIIISNGLLREPQFVQFFIGHFFPVAKRTFLQVIICVKRKLQVFCEYFAGVVSTGLRTSVD